MKTLSALLTTYLRSGRHRGNLGILARLLVLLLLIVVVYSVGFHVLMEQEGQSHSWLTGFYWTMVTMSTLGFGDITFQSDLGRVFSVIVLATGTIYLLILLPFTFIQFFYAPWLEARDAARAPRELPADMTGHVLLTGYGPIETALIPQLQQFRTPYVIIVPDLPEALRVLLLAGRRWSGTRARCTASAPISCCRSPRWAPTRSSISSAGGASCSLPKGSKRSPFRCRAGWPAGR